MEHKGIVFIIMVCPPCSILQGVKRGRIFIQRIAQEADIAPLHAKWLKDTLLQICAEGTVSGMAAYNIGQKAEAIVAVAHALSGTAGKMGLAVQTACHPADSFLRKVFSVHQFLFQTVFYPHFLSSFIHNDSWKGEVAATVAHQMA